MSELRKTYENSGYKDLKRLEKTPHYLSQLAVRSALEVDNYLIGKETDLAHTYEFAEILGRNNERKGSLVVSSVFPYLKISDVFLLEGKDLKTIDNLADEILRFRVQLNNIPNLPKTDVESAKKTLLNICNILM